MSIQEQIQAYNANERARQAAISENRSRRMRRNPLPPVPVPAKVEKPWGYLVDTKDGGYVGFFRSQDLAEVKEEVAEVHDPADCVFTRQAILGA